MLVIGMYLLSYFRDFESEIDDAWGRNNLPGWDDIGQFS